MAQPETGPPTQFAKSEIDTPGAPRAPCIHCGTLLTRAQASALRKNDLAFCCRGCRTVHSILTSNGLSRFYDLRRQSGDAFQRPVASSTETYAYLDDPVFRERHARATASGARDSMDFYLEGVHCVACLWLIEKLPALAPDVVSATLDMGKAVARVTVKPGHPFRKAAKTLAGLGYRPHAIELDEDIERRRNRENRGWLIRIGVSGACAGNIMLMTVPLYSGLGTGGIATSFRWISAAFFLPVLAYAATPFYRSAWGALRARAISIDLPIVLALLIGAGASLHALFAGTRNLYFDSLASLVFLLLSSRYVLRRIQQKALRTSHLFQFLSPSVAKRIDSSSSRLIEVDVSSLQAGDLIRVEHGDTIPVDGNVASGQSAINCAALTGESLPQAVGPGDSVYAGTINEGTPLDVRVESTGRRTRLGKLILDIESGNARKPKIVAAADRAARWFLLAVLTACAATFFLAPTMTDGLARALALAIVTCPCALALATPLAMSVSLAKAAKAGILVRDAVVLEKVAQSDGVALDKTGTVTEGRFELLEWTQLVAEPKLAAMIRALESRSKHPIARALLEALEPRSKGYDLAVEQLVEIPGLGVEGRVDGRHLLIHPYRGAKGTAVSVLLDGAEAARIRLGDRLRADSAACVSQLKSLGLTPCILSGDNHGAVHAAGWELELAPEQLVSEADPVTKRRFMADHARALMVGDGANDAAALSAAFVGIATHGSMEISMRAADVYLTQPGLRPVVQLVRLARETMRVIRRNFAFSLAYNLIGGIAAATGHITPLSAAILMPLSAFTVFSSSFLGRREPR